MRVPRLHTVAAILAAASALSSCGSDGTGPNAPASIGATSGTGQASLAGQALTAPIVVRVTSSAGDAVEGAQVTFSASDGGSATPAQATTNASGSAQTTWTLGPAVTTQTLTAQAGGVQVQITAEAYDGCDSRAWSELTFGSTISGTLTPSACDLGGGIVGDVYHFDVLTDGAVTVQMVADDDALLFLGPASDVTSIYAVDDDGLEPTNSEIRILLVPGSYLVFASHFPGTSLGDYELEAMTGGGLSELCALNLWIVSGVSTNQELEDDDCELEDESRFDLFSAVVPSGATLTVEQSSTELDAFIRLFDESGILVSSDDDSGAGTDARLVYTATAGDSYPFIAPGAADVEGRGAHTVTVDISAGSQLRTQDGRVHLPTHLIRRKGRR